jgi:hypothetical protein
MASLFTQKTVYSVSPLGVLQGANPRDPMETLAQLPESDYHALRIQHRDMAQINHWTSFPRDVSVFVGDILPNNKDWTAEVRSLRRPAHISLTVQLKSSGAISGPPKPRLTSPVLWGSSSTLLSTAV